MIWNRIKSVVFDYKDPINKINLFRIYIVEVPAIIESLYLTYHCLKLNWDAKCFRYEFFLQFYNFRAKILVDFSLFQHAIRVVCLYIYVNNMTDKSI